MDSPEVRRRRKHSSRTSPKQFLLLLRSHLFSVRSFLLCFGFLVFILLLSYILRLNSSGFKPVLVVSSFPLLSSRSDSSRGSKKFPSLAFVQDRISLPDHVLLLLNTGGFVHKVSELDCVYGRSKNISVNERGSPYEIIRQKVISVDNFDDSRLVVRCPIPPENFSVAVNLESQRKEGVQQIFGAKNGLGMDFNQSVYSWEKVAFAATLDKDTAVVFAKGLNIRGGREANPDLFRCHFRFKDSDTGREKSISSRALTAAQEVVRCSLPQSIKNNTKEGQEIQVTIGVTRRVSSRARENVVLPSVARFFSPKLDEGKDGNKPKHDLCVCTMVWNQAAMLREWITYHGWLGVERWFIYDNNSDDEIKEVIDELNEYNVTRHVWPWVKTQEAGFSHCALRAKDECNWVSFMDVDEFFYFPYSSLGHHRHSRLGYARQNGLRALVANISSSSKIGEIRTTCHSFGPSGLTSPPARGVTTGYTCRLQSPERHKSIIRPKALDPTLLTVVHHFRLAEGYTFLDLHQSIAVINHYKYQVWDVFKAKFYRRVATYVADWQNDQNKGSKDRAPGLGTEAIEPPNWSRQFCDVWDTGLHDFVLTYLANRSSGLLPWERSLDQ